MFSKAKFSFFPKTTKICIACKVWEKNWILSESVAKSVIWHDLNFLHNEFSVADFRVSITYASKNAVQQKGSNKNNKKTEYNIGFEIF